MAPRTCSLDLRLAEQAKNPKVHMRGRARDSRSFGVNSNNEGGDSKRRSENTQPTDNQLMDIMEEAGAE